ncbi:MAG: hypothetical protein RR514_05465 [Christensenella sp.]
MRSGYGNRTNKSSLVIMFAALTLLFVFIANLLPVLRITMYFIASVFMMGIMVERMPIAAIITFISVLFLGFLIIPIKTGMLPYLFFFGHYAIFKYFVDADRRGALNIVKKLIYFNVGAALIYFQTAGFMTEQFPIDLPWWALLIGGELVFLLYDWLFTKVTTWYYGALRNKLLNTGEF